VTGWRRSGRRLSYAGIALALMAASCGPGQDEGGQQATEPEAPVQVDVGAFPGPNTGSWAVGIAKDQGFFEREGLDVEVTYTFDGGQLLAGGQLDLISDGADSGLVAFAQGKDVIAVAPVTMLAADALVVQPDIESVADLAGKTLRVTNFGTDEFLAREFIEAQGLSPDEVEWVSIDEDGPALVQLENARIDGGMFSQGFALEAEETGEYNVLARPSDFGRFPWNVLQTTRTFADENPEALVGFIRAILSAIEFIQDPANRDAVIDSLVAVQEGLPREDVEASYQVAESVDFNMFSLDPLTVDDVAPALGQLVFLGEDVSDVDLNAFVDSTYFEQAT
jgi:ABC-type nitrate/sulfonate/bicarbonate transport system substrate-binding protein